jgi:nucleoid-associated protein YgaU
MLTSVTVNYERFDPYGIPIYATADLTMKDYTEPLPYTNPTSGGLPGRTKHVVTAGENVVRIAQQNYGSPNAWRALAEANDLDDPLRVKPGKLLYLPGPGELEEARA